MKESRLSRFRATLDRIEQGYGVLYLEDKDKIDLALRYLPPAARAGDSLIVTIEIDESETSRRRSSIERLQRELLERGKRR